MTSQLDHNLFMAWSQLIHYLLKTFKWLVHDLFKTCSGLQVMKKEWKFMNKLWTIENEYYESAKVLNKSSLLVHIMTFSLLVNKLFIKLISAQTGNGTMKMFTSCRIDLSVDSWPQKMKDIQLLSYYLIRSCMSFLSVGQLSTDKLVVQFAYIFTVSLPGNEISSSPNRNDKIKYTIRSAMMDWDICNHRWCNQICSNK